MAPLNVRQELELIDSNPCCDASAHDDDIGDDDEIHCDDADDQEAINKVSNVQPCSRCKMTFHKDGKDGITVFEL